MTRRRGEFFLLTFTFYLLHFAFFVAEALQQGEGLVGGKRAGDEDAAEPAFGGDACSLRLPRDHIGVKRVARVQNAQGRVLPHQPLRGAGKREVGHRARIAGEEQRRKRKILRRKRGQSIVWLFAPRQNAAIGCFSLLKRPCLGL
jgi:hypothetical protein